MELAIKLMVICAVVSISTAQLNYNNPVYIPEYIQTQSSNVEALQEPPRDQEQEPANMNIQQLPKEETPKPFFTSEPQLSTVLRAPTEDASVTNFNTQSYPPIPSQDLELPSLIKWNPNDDPNLYYPVTIDKVVPLNIPTNLYPKKYSKDLQKIKPSAFKLKEIDEIEDAVKQKDVDKVLNNFAKQENKKLLQLQKLTEVPLTANNDKVDLVDKVNAPQEPIPAASVFGSFSSPSSTSSSHAANSFGLSHDGFSNAGLHSHGSDRMEFHMRGHDGPKSYKWGYDTGKGHNRHFRYEEKDKHGYVKGYYGYYDKHGKLRMMHYDSAPHEGFHASHSGTGPDY